MEMMLDDQTINPEVLQSSWEARELGWNHSDTPNTCGEISLAKPTLSDVPDANLQKYSWVNSPMQQSSLADDNPTNPP